MPRERQEHPVELPEYIEVTLPAERRGESRRKSRNRGRVISYLTSQMGSNEEMIDIGPIVIEISSSLLLILKIIRDHYKEERKTFPRDIKLVINLDNFREIIEKRIKSRPSNQPLFSPEERAVMKIEDEQIRRIAETSKSRPGN